MKKMIALNTQDLVRRYLAGESVKALAGGCTVDRSVIARHLKAAGVSLRGIKEASILWMGQTSPEHRARITSAAHDAVRGSRKSADVLATRARYNEAKGRSTVQEAKVLEDLVSRGVVVRPQVAIGPYNCDLGAYPVAVEIFGGYFHFYGKHRGSLGRRLRFILEQGWHVLIVHLVPGDGFGLTETTADHVVAHLEQMSRLPSTVREYRMIRGTGELRACGGLDHDERTIVETLCRRK